MRKFHVNRLAPASLLLMAMLWGSTLIVLKDLVTVLPAADLVAWRFVLAFAALALIAPRALRMSRRTAGQGILLGLLYGAGQLLQTWGLGHIDASVSGFLTGSYVVLTPLIGLVVFGKKVGRTVWYAVAMATVGLAILSLNPGAGMSLGLGELLTLVGALAFAAHIVATGRTVTPKNALQLTIAQSATVAVVTTVAALPGGIAVPSGTSTWAGLAFLGVICGALPFFLQVWAQAHVDATKAALVMGTEPLWAALFAIGMGGEQLTARLLIGGLVITAAIILVTLPGRRRGSRSRGSRRPLPTPATTRPESELGAVRLTSTP